MKLIFCSVLLTSKIPGDFKCNISGTNEPNQSGDMSPLILDLIYQKRQPTWRSKKAMVTNI